MLAIHLRNPQETFAQGSEVAGQVIYQPNVVDGGGVPPVRMLIELRGRTKTKIHERNQGTHRGRADLLYLIMCDMQGANTVWPFSFPFPATASPVDPQVAERRSRTSQMKSVPADHPLPPSFRIIKSFTTFECFTEYVLRATLWPLSSGQDYSKPLLEQELVLDFQPRFDPRLFYQGEKVLEPKEFEVINNDCRVKSLLLSPKYRDRDLTFREKSMSVFKRSQLPFFNFRTVLEFPLRVHVAQNLTCKIRLELSPESSTAPEIPTFTLKYAKFDLDKSTSAYTSSLLTDQIGADYGIEGARMEDLGEFLPAAGYTKTVTVPLHAPPTFTTFNIENTYNLTFRAKVECAGQAFRIAHVAEFTILPPLWGAAAMSTYSCSPSFGNISSVDGGGEGLPLSHGEKPPYQGEKPPYAGGMSPYQGEKPPYQGQKPPYQDEKPFYEGDMPPKYGDKPPYLGDMKKS